MYICYNRKQNPPFISEFVSPLSIHVPFVQNKRLTVSFLSFYILFFYSIKARHAAPFSTIPAREHSNPGRYSRACRLHSHSLICRSFKHEAKVKCINKIEKKNLQGIKVALFERARMGSNNNAIWLKPSNKSGCEIKEMYILYK